MRNDGLKTTFSVLRSDVLLQELCAPDDELQTDWDEQQSIGDSPHSENNYGGYATPEVWEIWACPEGQAVFWTWTFEWGNALPYVAYDVSSDFKCRVLRGFSNNTYGWCQD